MSSSDRHDGDQIRQGASSEDDDETRLDSGESLDKTQLIDDDDVTRIDSAEGSDEDQATRMRVAPANSEEETVLSTAEAGGEETVLDSVTATQRMDEGATVVADDATTQGAMGSPASPGVGVDGVAALEGEIILNRRYKYNVNEDFLGGGGMGNVFRAVDLELLQAGKRDPYVAVKVLGERFAKHPEAIKSLIYETDRSRILSHDNIARVYTFDRDGDTIFMVMELLRGVPLDGFLKREENAEGVGKELAFQIASEVGAGLGFAHREGLVHSDLKPGNCFVVESERGLQAKVIDFGIARAAANPDEANTGEAIEAGEHESKGEKTYFDPSSLNALTPTYASLEMFRGDLPHPSDDVYALALVTYYLLTGRHPYDKKSALTIYTELQGITPKAAKEKGLVPERPAILSNREWRALQRGMSIEREHRQQDAKEFIEELMGERNSIAPWIGLGVAAVITVAAVSYNVFFAPDPVVLEGIEANTTDARALRTLETARSGAVNLLDLGFGPVQGNAPQALEGWLGSAGDQLFLTQRFADEDSARAYRDELGRQIDYGLRLEQDEGGYRLVAGPFVSDRSARFAALKTELDALGIEYESSNEVAQIESYRADLGAVYLQQVNTEIKRADEAVANDSLNAAGNILGRAEAMLVEAQERAFTISLSERNNASDQIAFARDRIAQRQRELDTQLAAANRRQQQINSLVAGTRDLLNCNNLTTARLESGLGNLRRALFPTATRGDLMRGADACLRNKFQTLEEAPYMALREVAVAYDADYFQLPLPNRGNADLIRNIAQGFESTDLDKLDEAVALFSLQFDTLKSDERQLLVDQLASNISGSVADQPEWARSALVSAQGLNRYADTWRRIEATLPKPDPCRNPNLVGRGKRAICRDVFEGGRGPALVIVPALPGSSSATAIGVSRDEITRADFAQFCRSQGCREDFSDGGTLPVTGISRVEAEKYMQWLKDSSGKTYRFPTAAEWQHVADAQGSDIDGNRNCFGNVGGVSRGQTLVSVEYGAKNNWGLRNHIGNAREWALDGGSLQAMGGAHTDPLSRCTLDAAVPHEGGADGITGLRLVREL